MGRARQSIQHAHKYFSDALKASDNLNPSSKGSLLSEGFGGDLVSMSKQNEYKGRYESLIYEAQNLMIHFFCICYSAG